MDGWRYYDEKPRRDADVGPGSAPESTTALGESELSFGATGSGGASAPGGGSGGAFASGGAAGPGGASAPGGGSGGAFGVAWEPGSGGAWARDGGSGGAPTPDGGPGWGLGVAAGSGPGSGLELGVAAGGDPGSGLKLESKPEPKFGLAPGRTMLDAFDPGRRGLRALIAVGVVAALIAAYLAWRAQPHAEPVTPIASTARVTSPGPSPPASIMVVAVQGKVAHPGLVRLPAGSRVADALTAAGGPLAGVDLSLVNLARRLTDGELIVIGLPQPAGGGTGAAAGAGPASGAKINLNTASLTDLESLPGIGPALAQHILDYRAQHGDFTSVEDLRHVSGVGDAKFSSIKDLVTV